MNEFILSLFVIAWPILIFAGEYNFGFIDGITGTGRPNAQEVRQSPYFFFASHNSNFNH